MYRICILVLFLTSVLVTSALGADIHQAASDGNVATLRTLLEPNPELVTARDTAGSLPLHLAALNGHLESVKLLVEAGANVSEGDRENSTPLICAAIGGHLSVARYLIGQGTDINESDDFGQTALTAVVSRGSLELVDYLAEAGADVNHRSAQGWTALHRAAFRDNAAMIRRLVELGAEVHARDNDSMSVFSGAAYSGRVNALEALIELGCDVNEAPTIHGHTPLMAAIWNNRAEAVNFLIDRGADLTREGNGGTSLVHLAASRGHVEVLQALAEEGVDLNEVNEEGATALHIAAGEGDIAAAQFLIEQGLDIDAVTNHGERPIGFAAWNHAEMVQWLIEQGVDPGAASDDSRAPLVSALYGGNLESVRALIAAGVDLEGGRSREAIPLHIAIGHGDYSMTELLLQGGADVNQREGTNDLTPLHVAVAAGRGDLTRLLVAHGADIEARDRDSNTPLYYAAKYGHRTAASVLSDAGATNEGLVENFGTPSRLDEPVAGGEAVIWYLGHSAWGLKTSGHFIIFDYDHVEPGPDEPRLSNGHIVPNELAEALEDTRVFVFSSHEHGDHYDTVIFSWRETLGDVIYILGHEPEDQTNCTYLPPRTDRAFGGVHVWTIHSTDAGVGYLLEVDGLTIFHAGDHANGEVGLHAEYTDEIDYLASLGKTIDLAFLPITGCSLGTPESVREGVYYALDKLNPKVFVPQHGGRAGYRYRDFLAQARTDGYSVPAFCAVCGGDSFVYPTNPTP